MLAGRHHPAAVPPAAPCRSAAPVALDRRQRRRRQRRRRWWRQQQQQQQQQQQHKQPRKTKKQHVGTSAYWHREAKVDCRQNDCTQTSGFVPAAVAARLSTETLWACSSRRSAAEPCLAFRSPESSEGSCQVSRSGHMAPEPNKIPHNSMSVGASSVFLRRSSALEPTVAFAVRGCVSRPRRKG